MDYQLENLGPERFQQLCQALLAHIHPDTQCYPVGQPDGGRDAISLHHRPGRARSFVVFQIKYVRHPFEQTDQEDIVAWLRRILLAEAPKITTLTKIGANRYYLLTNLSGTAHLHGGSIDKVSDLLSEHISVPTMCWWRDDINRRLDDAWSIKWAYPDILTGPDILRYVVENGLSEDRERRSSAIRSFVQSQYDRDREVKFKQVDLQNNLVDLFVDVPIILRRSRADANDYLLRSLFQPAGQPDEPPSAGAATMMLHPTVQSSIPQLLLEGAPGQGKSTITQFVCQVHRIAILGKQASSTNLSPAFIPTATRLPIRSDLRDLATWLGGEDPFSESTEVSQPHRAETTLETFLAAQIRYQSGGAPFTVSDLHAIARVSSLLLVLDGLDEVADITRRADIVREITNGTSRLRSVAASLQVIVTSRPAAFANSPGLSESQFYHISLDALTPSNIDAYTEKWIAAKHLPSQDAANIKRILRQKLQQTHLRDLSRNPMQLAILLSLIHTRGISLPDKRTALYQSYVDLFFDREAEKSSTVRDHRDLLIDIHRYLGWALHSSAEEGKHSGSVTTEHLRSLLETYLQSEGRPPTLAAELFAGMVERVVFLVSRIQGSFEFEVQPLREYFAARHLYETAPYSPPGNERRGTRPDRFTVMARNFYWLNVTRFYAGCYSKGELPSLVDCLQELAAESEYNLISLSQMLSGMLLADWVFAQNQKSMRAAVGLVLSGLGRRHALSDTSPIRRRSFDVLALPSNCGRTELVQECRQILQSHPARDYAMEIAEIWVANSSRQDRLGQWIEDVSNSPPLYRPFWFSIGLHLGVLALVPDQQLSALLSGGNLEPSILSAIINGGRGDFLVKKAEWVRAAIEGVLAGDILVSSRRRDKSVLTTFCQRVSTDMFVLGNRWSDGEFFVGMLQETESVSLVENSITKETAQMLQACIDVIEVIRRETKCPPDEWATGLDHWDAVCESIRGVGSSQWAAWCIANFAAGIRSHLEQCVGYSDLLDHSISLCRRVRYARLRSGSQQWWRAHFERISSHDDLLLTLLVFSSWASTTTVLELVDIVQPLVGCLSQSDWDRLCLGVQKARSSPIFGLGRSPVMDGSKLPERMAPRLATVLGSRVSRDDATTIYERYLSDYDGDDKTVLEFCQDMAFGLVRADPERWSHLLSVVRKSYVKGAVGAGWPRYRWYRLIHGPERVKLPLSVAREIAREPEFFPRDLVSWADDRCREELQGKIVPVAVTARRQGWFEEH